MHLFMYMQFSILLCVYISSYIYSELHVHIITTDINPTTTLLLAANEEELSLVHNCRGVQRVSLSQQDLWNGRPRSDRVHLVKTSTAVAYQFPDAQQTRLHTGSSNKKTHTCIKSNTYRDLYFVRSASAKATWSTALASKFCFSELRARRQCVWPRPNDDKYTSSLQNTH